MENPTGKYIGTYSITSFSIQSGDDDGKIVVNKRYYDAFEPGDFGEFDKIEPIIVLPNS